MDKFFEILKEYGSTLAIIGSSLAFIFSVWKYYVERRTNLFWKEFEVYHKLVAELVETPNESGVLYVDRQAAILFELRNFKRYYPYSLRMLKGLLAKWEAVPGQFPRLLEEVKLTIGYLESKL